MKVLEIIEADCSSAEKNMERDQAFLQSLEKDPRAILHFYNWEKPSLTYGYFTDVDKLLHRTHLQEDGIDMARRPTGGGVTFHMWDLAFSFLLPATSSFFSKNPLQNYAFVHQMLLQALQPWLPIDQKIEVIPEDFPITKQTEACFCMARPTKYDLVYAGKKIAGAAQRKTQFGFLHQGSISCQIPDANLLQRWVKDPAILLAMRKYSYVFSAQKEALQQSIQQSFFQKLQ